MIKYLHFKLPTCFTYKRENGSGREKHSNLKNICVYENIYTAPWNKNTNYEKCDEMVWFLLAQRDVHNMLTRKVDFTY